MLKRKSIGKNSSQGLRTQFLSVPLSKEENDKISNAANKAGLAKATWARVNLLQAAGTSSMKKRA